MNEPTGLLTIEQAAKFLNVSETSLRRWTNDGRLACVRIGEKKVRRFRKEDLLAFLNHQPAKTPATFAEPGKMVIGGIAVQHGTHLCSLYSGATARTKLTLDFIADGLQQNCACYLVLPPEGSRDVLNQLQEQRPQIKKDIADGRLIVSEHQESGPAQIKKFEASFKSIIVKGITSIRMVCNISEGRMAIANSFDHIIQYEKDYERLIAKKFPVVTMCQYDANRHSGTELLEALKCHRDAFTYPPERLLL